MLPLLCALSPTDSYNEKANNLMKKVVTTEHHMIQNVFFPFFLDSKSHYHAVTKAFLDQSEEASCNDHHSVILFGP